MSEFVAPPRFAALHSEYRTMSKPVPRDTIIAELQATRDPALLELIADYRRRYGPNETISRSQIATDLQDAIGSLVDHGYLHNNMDAVAARLARLVTLWGKYRSVEVAVTTVISQMAALGEPQATDEVVASFQAYPAGATLLFEEVEEILLARIMKMLDEHHQPARA